MCIFFLEKYFLTSYARVKIQLVLIVEVEQRLHKDILYNILNARPLSDIWFRNIKMFFLFSGISFYIFSMMSFETKVFNLLKSDLCIFSSVTCAFGGVSKKALANSRLQRFISLFSSKNYSFSSYK